MQRIIKQNKLVILVGLCLLLIAFYWYSLRPYQARKYCSGQAFIMNHEGEINSSDWLDNQEKLYTDCLRWKGLSK
jgi:hypothetical protein